MGLKYFLRAKPWLFPSDNDRVDVVDAVLHTCKTSNLKMANLAGPTSKYMLYRNSWLLAISEPTDWIYFLSNAYLYLRCLSNQISFLRVHAALPKFESCWGCRILYADAGRVTTACIHEPLNEAYQIQYLHSQQTYLRCSNLMNKISHQSACCIKLCHWYDWKNYMPEGCRKYGLLRDIQCSRKVCDAAEQGSMIYVSHLWAAPSSSLPRLAPADDTCYWRTDLTTTLPLPYSLLIFYPLSAAAAEAKLVKIGS